MLTVVSLTGDALYSHQTDNCIIQSVANNDTDSLLRRNSTIDEEKMDNDANCLE